MGEVMEITGGAGRACAMCDAKNCGRVMGRKVFFFCCVCNLRWRQAYGRCRAASHRYVPRVGTYVQYIPQH